MQTRRTFLAAGTVCAATIPLTAGAQTCKVPFDRARYEKCISLYCAFDPAFLDFYAEDVAMSLGPLQIRGRQAVYESFKKARENQKESSEVTFFASDANGMAAQLSGTFEAVRDFDDRGRMVKKGELRRGRALLIYTLDRSGKIKTIGGALPELVQDWHFDKT